MEPENCPFCNPLRGDIVARNDLSYARWDLYPVSRGHLLIIPFRHTPDLFSMTPEEKRSILDLADECSGLIQEKFGPDGFTVGFNIGKAAGQTILHGHCHIIPRYSGDVPNPLGGIRGVIPSMRVY